MDLIINYEGLNGQSNAQMQTTKYRLDEEHDRGRVDIHNTEARTSISYVWWETPVTTAVRLAFF